jgi:cell division protein ZapA (FtsZ GTPase activity inhibitor)
VHHPAEQVIKIALMNEFSITVNIADRIYRLSIGKGEEEVVKRAAKLINERINEYAKSYAFKDKQDLLAMAALQFVTSLLNQEHLQDTAGQDLAAKIEKIDGLLNQQLEKQKVL